MPQATTNSKANRAAHAAELPETVDILASIVDRKEDGKWLVWHQHFSVPYDPATGKAVLDAKS